MIYISDPTRDQLIETLSEVDTGGETVTAATALSAYELRELLERLTHTEPEWITKVRTKIQTLLIHTDEAKETTKRSNTAVMTVEAVVNVLDSIRGLLPEPPEPEGDSLEVVLTKVIDFIHCKATPEDGLDGHHVDMLEKLWADVKGVKE